MLQKSVVFLLCFYMVFAQNLTSDDEDFSTIGVLNDFLTHLEAISGLSTLEPDRLVIGVNCPDVSQCLINPNGTVLWDARADLYRSYMMQGTTDEIAQQTTIDGCLKYNPTDNSSYNTCMSHVRTNMRIYLIVNFLSSIRKLIDADCSLVQENCI